MITGLYSAVPGRRMLSEMSDSGTASLTRKNFNSYKSGINGNIRKAFGSGHARLLEIAAPGGRPDTRFGLRLDKSRIRIE